MADASVRAARPADVAAVADLQIRTWQAAYAHIVPARALARLDESQAEAAWRDAVERPPSPRHRLLVALDSDRLVGMAAIGPARDDDRDAPADGEIYVLLVEVGATRGQGHGSRLLNAAIEQLRQDGFATALTWLFATDVSTRAFYEGAGWAADGATRELDMGEPTQEVRLHTAL